MITMEQYSQGYMTRDGFGNRSMDPIELQE